MSEKSFFKGVAIVFAVVAFCGVAVNVIAGKKLRSALAGLPGARVEFKKASVSLIGGNVELRDVDFALTDSTGVTPDVKGHVKTLRLERIRWFRLLKGEADAGPVKARAMHLYSCVEQEELALRLGKVSAMWYDVLLDSLYVSPLNIPRLVSSRQVAVDSIGLRGTRAVILQDDRYAPAVPYDTFQESLNAVPWPLKIGKLDARLQDFTFLWEVTHKNRGAFPMKNVALAVNSVSNAEDNVMELRLSSGQKGHSRMDMKLFVRNDKAESTQGVMHIYNLDASHLDGFLRPLFGATAQARIHQIECIFKGNKHTMKEDFCMAYENLAVKAWKDEYAPYRLVAKNSGALTFMANLVLPKANPLSSGREPKRVAVEFKRDPMLPYPSYLIQNITMGALRTVLPGGRIHKIHQK